MEPCTIRSERRRLMKEVDILPPLSESPFGPFPPGYGIEDNASRSVVKTGGRRRTADTVSPQRNADRGAVGQVLVGHTGVGGMTSSTFKGKNQGKAALTDGCFGDPQGPGKAGAMQRQKIPPTLFRQHYVRGDLPITIQHNATDRSLSWRVDPEKLDYHHYLPIFFDGLRELEEPFAFVASQGCNDMLERGAGKILSTIPQLIAPLKTALNTKHPRIVINVAKVIQKLVLSSEYVGEALVPYFRQLLPTLGLFKEKNKNLLDKFDYSQRKKENLGDLVNETLQILEMYGGKDAFINIKYIIPTYESCVYP